MLNTNCPLLSTNLNKNEGPCKKDNFSFGLSLLHARIRFFETMLHVAYRLPIKKWNVRLSAEEKQVVEDRKKEIQSQIKEKLGLLVDMPKANFGNTNDGNTSRRFFEEYEISAEITGVDKNLIYRLKIILDALCSGMKINVEQFEKYCKETAEVYVTLYNFYPMSLHYIKFFFMEQLLSRKQYYLLGNSQRKEQKLATRILGHSD
ncbi:hypothetical protein PYW07_008398 [Mythimna separata]|uniref:Uncharacterized protein n=1 Tax=Mythimna separata TaxID=271217 RepID=A0AAD7YD33_MYTSE|nr:hypothetical protein PYW07_008398 [Mythimna separata]